MEHNSQMRVLYDTATVVTLEIKNNNAKEHIISVFTLDNNTREPTFQQTYLSQNISSSCFLAKLDNTSMVAVWDNNLYSPPYIIWLWNV